jgi:hypothetical protein
VNLSDPQTHHYNEASRSLQYIVLLISYSPEAERRRHAHRPSRGNHRCDP